MPESSQSGSVFIDTAEGITLVCEDDHMRAATPLELRLREDMQRFRTAAQVNTPGSLQKFVLKVTEHYR